MHCTSSIQVCMLAWSRGIERSIAAGLEWAVFEPNAEPLWAGVRSAVEAFLTNLWRDGALLGNKAEEAFFVACGLGRTMTAADVDAGRLIVEVGVAVQRPAEFLILRFDLKTQGTA